MATVENRLVPAYVEWMPLLSPVIQAHPWAMTGPLAMAYRERVPYMDRPSPLFMRKCPTALATREQPAYMER